MPIGRNSFLICEYQSWLGL